MLFFVISLAAGVAAVLVVQKLDIELLNPPAPKRSVAKPAMPKQNVGVRGPASGGYVPGSVYLRQQ
jgi:hypothetical protein